jgi:hypothetical protein
MNTCELDSYTFNFQRHLPLRVELDCGALVEVYLYKVTPDGTIWLKDVGNTLATPMTVREFTELCYDHPGQYVWVEVEGYGSERISSVDTGLEVVRSL